MSYWDTSAVVKLYVPEADSPVFEQFLTQAATRGTVSRITSWEAYSTFRRKELERAIHGGGARSAHEELVSDMASGEWRAIEMSAEVEAEFAIILDQCADHVPPLFLRTLDAVHLASARVAGEAEIVATDKRLRETALALGFTVFPK